MIDLKAAFAEVLVADIKERSDKTTPKLVDQHIKQTDLDYDINARSFVAMLRDDLSEAIKNGESKRVRRSLEKQIEKYTCGS